RSLSGGRAGWIEARRWIYESCRSRARAISIAAGRRRKGRHHAFLMILAATLTFTGFLTARSIYVRSQPSWLDGGFGRFETGARTAIDSAVKDQEEAQLGADWMPAPWLRVHGHGIARRKGSGLIEAYVDLQKDFGANNFRLRAGQFFLPTSHENTDRLWSSPYTISF